MQVSKIFVGQVHVLFARGHAVAAWTCEGHFYLVSRQQAVVLLQYLTSEVTRTISRLPPSGAESSKTFRALGTGSIHAYSLGVQLRVYEGDLGVTDLARIIHTQIMRLRIHMRVCHYVLRAYSTRMNHHV